MKLEHQQSESEEVANSVSHGWGLVAGLIGTPILLLRSLSADSAAFIVGASLLCAAILVLYGASTLYHELPAGKTKRVFRILDHSSIYFLIAGTVSPFTLRALSGA